MSFVVFGNSFALRAQKRLLLVATLRLVPATIRLPPPVGAQRIDAITQRRAKKHRGDKKSAVGGTWTIGRKRQRRPLSRRKPAGQGRAPPIARNRQRQPRDGSNVSLSVVSRLVPRDNTRGGQATTAGGGGHRRRRDGRPEVFVRRSLHKTPPAYRLHKAPGCCHYTPHSLSSLLSLSFALVRALPTNFDLSRPAPAGQQHLAARPPAFAPNN
uniref:Secreted protein n=1 Tax=Plectus sambesii TaxID=2011161 RepID=A0A914VER1_9BILA